jgi:hypothetical protein
MPKAKAFEVKVFLQKTLTSNGFQHEFDDILESKASALVLKNKRPKLMLDTKISILNSHPAIIFNVKRPQVHFHKVSSQAHKISPQTP